jgi:hypothetical protein
MSAAPPDPPDAALQAADIAPDALKVAVVFERIRQPNAWEAWSHRPLQVLPDDPDGPASPEVLHDDGRVRHTRHPRMVVDLHRDEGEGYWLNLSSGTPVWFVMWRSDPQDPSRAAPELVSMSYHVAGRLLDAQERVDTVPMDPEVSAWLSQWTALHYRPQPKERRRPASFRHPERR